jgi:hypothetical protein
VKSTYLLDTLKVPDAIWKSQALKLFDVDFCIWKSLLEMVLLSSGIAIAKNRQKGNIEVVSDVGMGVMMVIIKDGQEIGTSVR